MTIQSKDVLRLREKDYTLLGRGGGPLFKPTDVGIRPGWSPSSNSRGFIATYAVTGKSLVLDGLRVNANSTMAVGNSIPQLFGKSPEVSSLSDQLRAAGCEDPDLLASFAGLFVFTWKDLAAIIAYTGPLLAARDWQDRDEMFDHFQHPACGYADVLEVFFDNGQIVEERNHSSEIANISRRMLTMTEEEQYKRHNQIMTEVEACFSQEYDYRY